MKFKVVNRHNGKEYQAVGQHWPEHGWHIKVFDYSPDTWGRSTTGIGVGPVIDQGFQKQLEQRGWTIPELKPEPDIRNQEMDRLARSMKPQRTGQSEWQCACGKTNSTDLTTCTHCGKPLQESRRRRATAIVDHLLKEHCGHCGSPTTVALKPQPINLDRIPASEKRMGTKVEREHVTSAKDAIAIAAAHWNEQTKQKGVPPEKVNYYAQGKRKGLFPELGKAKSYMAGIDSLGL